VINWFCRHTDTAVSRYHVNADKDDPITAISYRNN